MQGEKRGQEVPGQSRDLPKKVPGLIDFFSPGTMGLPKPSRSLGPVLSRPVPGPSQDFLGQDSPVAITSTDQT